MTRSLAKFEKAIGVYFRDKDLLLQALTHSSYAYENRSKGLRDNEVLEFLGDSVVGLVLADFFCSTYPGAAEGELSKYKAAAASTASLSQLAKKIKLHKHILLGIGEEKSGGRKKRTILAGALEALAAAIYLDQGYDSARTLLLSLLDKSYKKVDSGRFLINNYKSALQEHFQKENLPAPVYKTLTSVGPDHKRTFFVEVCLGQYPLAKAKGFSKKSAEQKAAQIALRSLLGKKMKTLTGEMFILKK